MRQLVELQKRAKDFKALNAELIFIFREEQEGKAGLQKIKSRTKTTYTLATDLNKASTAAYSRGRRVFDNYVISRTGVVRGIIPGNLRDRATAEQLMKRLREIGAE